MRARTICANCGDPARLGGNSVGERAHLGYCAACYRAWHTSAHETRLLERGYPRELIGRSAYASRPSHPIDDSA